MPAEKKALKAPAPLAKEPLTPREQALYHALQEAKEHLEYIGWGDSWERSCAREAKLPELVDAALELCP